VILVMAAGRTYLFEVPGDRPVEVGGHALELAEFVQAQAVSSLWVPRTLSPYATWEYSWIRPPGPS
jgi:hypothetical protein